MAIVEKGLNVFGQSIPVIDVFPRQLLDWTVPPLLFVIAIVLRQILDLPTRSPPLSPARAPPQGIFEFDQTGGFDPADPEPIPDHASRGALEFDQSLPD